MPKKILSLLLAAISVFSLLCFSACGDDYERNVGIKLNGVTVSNDVLTYFLDKAKVEVGEGANYDAVIDKAVKLLSTYFKINSYAHAENIILSTAEKAAVSEKVSAYWGVYGRYYEKIGVTRETLTKVFTAEGYKRALLLHLYGEGGSHELQTARLYAQFRTEYVVFQVINGYFTKTDATGATSSVTKNEAEAIVLKFQNMANLINAGEKSMEEAADFLAASGYQSSVQTVILSKNDTISYPAGFFDKVKNIEARRATVIGTQENIFLVLRGEPDVNSDYFNDKKAEMIENIVGDEIDTLIEEYMTVEADVTDSVARAYYSLLG